MEEAAIQQAQALSGLSSKVAAGASTKSCNKQAYEDDDDAEQGGDGEQEQGATEVPIVAEDESIESAVELADVNETVELSAVPLEAVEISSPPDNNQGTEQKEEEVIAPHALNDSDEVDDDVFKELHVTEAAVEEPTSLQVVEAAAQAEALQAVSALVKADTVVIPVAGDESSVSSPVTEGEVPLAHQEDDEALTTLASATATDDDQSPALVPSSAAHDDTTPAEPEGGDEGGDQAPPEETVSTDEGAVVENTTGI